MDECQHEEFVADVKVAWLTDDEGGPVIGYDADVRISCAECGEPFTFLGLEVGSHPAKPMVSVDGQALRAPMAPASARQSMVDKLDAVLGRLGEA